MPVWSFAKKSVKVFLNFAFGQFFSQPLCDSQIFVTTSGFGCKDLYFNTERINALLAERGIPVIVCVAYVSELLLSLPSSVVISGVDVVIQAAPCESRLLEDDTLFSSMFSSMTAAAFAAAKVAGGSSDWLGPHESEVESEIDSSDGGNSTETAESGGLFSRIQRLFERLTKTAEKVDLDPSTECSFVDRKTKERVAYMIDSVIAQAAVVLQKINVRIECRLGLPGLNRASGLALSLDKLSITNQYEKTSEDQHIKSGNSRTEQNTNSDGWSWLWHWGTSNKSDHQQTVPTGSLSTTLHKSVRLEGVDLFWDLWDTTEQTRQRLGVYDGHPNYGISDFWSELSCHGGTETPGKYATVYPTEDNMVASARLLSLTGAHTARLSIRYPMFSCTQCGSADYDVNLPADAGDINSCSLFELCAHVDLGSIVACICPSQLYWLRLLFGQLSYIMQTYTNKKQSAQLKDRSECKSAKPSEFHGDQLEPSVGPSIDRLSVLSPHISPIGHSEEKLVDLDLSNPNESFNSVTHPLVDSKLFWSCVTNTSELTEPDAARHTTTIPTHNQCFTSGLSHSSGSIEPRFALSANVLCVALIAFYDDNDVFVSDSSISCHVDPDLCKSVGPATRRSIFEHVSSTESKDQTEEDNSSDDMVSGPVATDPAADEFVGHHSETSVRAAPTLRSLAALPGPFLFFSRFAGLLPWKQPSCPQDDIVGSSMHCGHVYDEVTSPMRIDRTDVDTGRISPACWVAHLRQQFAQLASPRDHICFVGGLWHFDLGCRSLPSLLPALDRNNQLQKSNFSAQLFATELTECLFSDTSPMVSEDVRFFELVTFPDRQRKSGDRVTRGVSDIPAISLSGPLSGLSLQWLSCPSSSFDSFNLDLSHCRIDVDISLSDRIHRIADGLSAASEAVSKFLPLTTMDPVAAPTWRQMACVRSEDSHVDSSTSNQHYSHNDATLRLRPQQPLPSTEPSAAYCLEDASDPLRNKPLDSRINLSVSCVGFEIFLRFPIPLQAVNPDTSQKLPDLHSNLWRMGIPLHLHQTTLSHSDSTDYFDHQPALAWWRQSLRPEYLRITFSKTTLTYHVPFSSTYSTCEFKSVATDQSALDRHSLPSTTFKAAKGLSGPEVQIAFRLLSVHLLSVHSKIQTAPLLQLMAGPTSAEFINISILFAPLGQQELLEGGIPHSHINDIEVTEPVYTFCRQRFEMGVDLASLSPTESHSGHPSGSKLLRNPSRPVEWSLWERTGPKQNPRIPFVIRRNFLQDTPNSHSKQLTYYPGDANHLAFYRQAAGEHSRFSVRCKVTTAVLHIEHKQTVEILNLRLLYDLPLWNSLLPTDRRLRATLTRHRPSVAPTDSAIRPDYCYWFLSDPAPLASIYAHPEAAREAAALEATNMRSNARHPSGLHFHPFYSDEEESEDDKADVFDAGLDSVYEFHAFNTTSSQSPKTHQPKRETPVSPATAFKRSAKICSNPTTRRGSCHSLFGSEDDDVADASFTTTVQKQSFLSFQLDVDTIELRITLPALSSTNSTRDSVRFNASGCTLFLESAHNGRPELDYATVEFNRLEAFFTALRSTAHCTQTNNDVDSQSPTWWPGLLFFSSHSAGYPFSHSSASEVDSGLCTLNGPMFTMAVEHKQVTQTSVRRDEFHCALRLQDACLVHWPHLEFSPKSDVALPGWLRGVLHIFETLSTPLLNRLLPGYQPPETLLVQHFHLERVAMTWSTLDAGRLSMHSHSSFNLESIRAFLGCESISVTVNTATETGSVSGSRAACSRGPGTLLLAFLHNAHLFLCPTYRKNIGTRESRTAASLSSDILTWVSSLRLADCVCVADLNHLEVRCFSHPMQVSQQVGSQVLQSFINRVDVRATDNLLRLNACADSLVALECILEALKLTPALEPATADSPIPQLRHEQLNSSDTPSTIAAPLNLAKITDQPPISHKLSANSLTKYDSGNRLDDLLHGAISDYESSNPPIELTMSSTSRTSFHTRSSSSSQLERSTVLGKSISPEPRPCLTSHPDRKLRGATTANRSTERIGPVSSTNSHPYLTLPDIQCVETTSNLEVNITTPSSVRNDFVIIKSSMLPQNVLSPTSPRVAFKWLTPSSAENGAFKLCENQYASPCESVFSRSKNRMRRLFTDPASVYPRASLALTLYNFCLEWNLFAGTDIVSFAQDTSRSNSRTGPTKISNHATDRLHSVVDRCNPDSLVDLAHLTTAHPSAVSNDSVKRTQRFRYDRSAMGSASLRRQSVPESTVFGQNSRQPNDNDSHYSSVQDLYSRGGQSRDVQKYISVRLSNVYFRHATFPANVVTVDSVTSKTTKAASVGDPANRYIFNIGSVLILDRVASSNINQLLYSYSKATTGSSVPHDKDTPVFRMAVVSWRVPSPQSIVSASSCKHWNENEEAGVPTSTESHQLSGPFRTTVSDSSLELEAKISCQPLRINLDQNTLLFMEEFQKLFSSCILGTEPTDSPSITTYLSSNLSSSDSPSSPCGNSKNQLLHNPVSVGGASLISVTDIPTAASGSTATSLAESTSLTRFVTEPAELLKPTNIFIRKVTFYPDLPIRLDYHGRNLEWNSGSMQGFLRTLLQLHNAELVIPRRVYQRGYPNLERLLEEVTADMRNILIAQLPQLLATCIGPMHEVTQFLIGLWDLVYQPMHSLYRGSRTTPSSLLEVKRGYWRTADLDMSTYDAGFNQHSANRAVLEPESSGGFIHGLRHGTRSFSTSTLWATLQLSIQGVRAVQSVAETAYDLLTPGPALRSRQLRLRQPADLREGFGNAVSAMSRGLQMVTEDFFGATRAQSDVDVGCKGPVGVIGDVIRQIPPTIVAPLVTGCEVTANILGGFRNQLRPEAKLEDEQKWKDTHGL